MEHHQDKFLCTFLNVTGEQISLHPCMHVHFRNEVQCMRDFRSSQLGKVYDFLSFKGVKCMTLYLLSQVKCTSLYVLSEVNCMTLYLLSDVKCMKFISSRRGKIHDLISSQRSAPVRQPEETISGVAVQVLLLAYSQDNRL